jgi:uncharacterized protein
LKLHADAPTTLHTVTAYGRGFVEIDTVRYTSPLLLAPDGPILPWKPASFDDLRESDFEALAVARHELVLLGTGERQRFPHPRLLQPLARARIGLEVMATAAACRTYNILVAEGRKVAAALLLDP